MRYWFKCDRLEYERATSCHWIFHAVVEFDPLSKFLIRIVKHVKISSQRTLTWQNRLIMLEIELRFYQTLKLKIGTLNKNRFLHSFESEIFSILSSISDVN